MGCKTYLVRGRMVRFGAMPWPRPFGYGGGMDAGLETPQCHRPPRGGGTCTVCLCTFPHNYAPGPLDHDQVRCLALLGATVVLLNQRAPGLPRRGDHFYLPHELPAWLVAEIVRHIPPPGTATTPSPATEYLAAGDATAWSFPAAPPAGDPGDEDPGGAP